MTVTLFIITVVIIVVVVVVECDMLEYNMTVLSLCSRCYCF